MVRCNRNGALPHGTVLACGTGTVLACETGTVLAYGTGTVLACRQGGTVLAYGTGTVFAYGIVSRNVGLCFGFGIWS